MARYINVIEGLGQTATDVSSLLAASPKAQIAWLQIHQIGEALVSDCSNYKGPFTMLLMDYTDFNSSLRQIGMHLLSLDLRRALDDLDKEMVRGSGLYGNLRSAIMNERPARDALVKYMVTQKQVSVGYELYGDLPGSPGILTERVAVPETIPPENRPSHFSSPDVIAFTRGLSGRKLMSEAARLKGVLQAEGIEIPQTQLSGLGFIQVFILVLVAVMAIAYWFSTSMYPRWKDAELREKTAAEYLKMLKNKDITQQQYDVLTGKLLNFDSALDNLVKSTAEGINVALLILAAGVAAAIAIPKILGAMGEKKPREHKLRLEPAGAPE